MVPFYSGRREPLQIACALQGIQKECRDQSCVEKCLSSCSACTLPFQAGAKRFKDSAALGKAELNPKNWRNGLAATSAPQNTLSKRFFVWRIKNASQCVPCAPKRRDPRQARPGGKASTGGAMMPNMLSDKASQFPPSGRRHTLTRPSSCGSRILGLIHDAQAFEIRENILRCSSGRFAIKRFFLGSRSQLIRNSSF